MLDSSDGVALGRIVAGRRECGVWVRRTPSADARRRYHLACHWAPQCHGLQLESITRRVLISGSRPPVGCLTGMWRPMPASSWPGRRGRAAWLRRPGTERAGHGWRAAVMSRADPPVSPQRSTAGTRRGRVPPGCYRRGHGLTKRFTISNQSRPDFNCLLRSVAVRLPFCCRAGHGDQRCSHSVSMLRPVRHVPSPPL